MQTDGRVVVVTGAGSGIGRRTSLAFLEAGYRVVLAGRRLANLEETLAAAPVGVAEFGLVTPCDVTDHRAVRSLFENARDRFGRIDLLFNNAGINIPATDIEDVTQADWNSVVAVNLTGMFWCIQEAVRQMKSQQPQGGRIINNGSISSLVPRPQSIAYNATKHAVTGMTKSVSLDGRKYGIACGQIDIGNADTSMVTQMKQGVLQANGELAVEPTIDPDDVARAVLYMAGLPLHANVQFMTVMATTMPYIGRG